MGIVNNTSFSEIVAPLSVSVVAAVMLIASGSMVKGQSLRPVADSVKNQLDSQQLRKYENQRLSVLLNPEEQTEVDVTHMSNEVLSQFVENTTGSAAEEYNRWIAYRGDFSVNESDFYEVIGKEDLSEEVFASRNKFERKPTTVRVLLQVGATGLVLYGIYEFAINSTESASNEYLNEYTASGLGLAGIARLLPKKRVKVELDEEVRLSSIIRAKEMAVEYNRQLIRDLATPGKGETQTNKLPLERAFGTGLEQPDLRARDIR